MTTKGSEASVCDDDVEMVDVDDPAVLNVINEVVAENKSLAPTPSKYSQEHKIEINPPSPTKQPTTASLQPALVLDTNFLISHLSLLEQIRELHGEYGHIIVVPWIVIQELDRLKESKRISSHITNDNVQRKSVSHLARAATNWIYKQLASNAQTIVGQKLTEINNLNLNGDDAILDCCRYFQERRNALTVILSNDKNLCTKSLIHGVRTVSYAKDMTARKIVQVVYTEAANGVAEEPDCDAMDIDDGIEFQEPVDPPKTTKPVKNVNYYLEKFEDTFLENVAFCIDKHMDNAYDHGELEYFGYRKSDIRVLDDCVDIINKFKIAVFGKSIPNQVLAQVKKCPPIPDTKEELLQFVDAWGAFWIYLSKGVQKTHKIQAIVDDMKARVNKLD